MTDAAHPAPVVRRLQIRWRDMDGFRHVNNAVYLSYLEDARDAFVETYAAEHLDRFVVRRVEIDYLSALHQDDGEAIVECSLEHVGSTSLQLVETIHASSDGRLAATARSVLVYTDESRERSEPMPPALRALFGAG